MRNFLIALALALVATLSRPASAQYPCRATSASCRAFTEFLESLNARDWPRFRRTFDDSVSVFLEAPAPAARIDGRAAVERFFAVLFPAAGAAPAPLPPPIVPVHFRLEELGSVAIATFEIDRPDATARRTIVLRETAAGWRVLHIHGSARPPE